MSIVRWPSSSSSFRVFALLTFVLLGASVSMAQGPYAFIPITPCRVADTRVGSGQFGAPEMSGNSSRTFNIPQSDCNIPSTAVAYSLNVTVLPSGPLNYLTLWPSGQAQPDVSTLNSDGRVKANAAIVPAGTNGGVSIFVSDATQVVLDINGYFVPNGTASALAFTDITQCRVVDTRPTNGIGPLAGPYIAAGTSRAFPILSSSCIPSGSTPVAYSLNITALPHKTLDYLTAWPTGRTRPNASNLNSSTGTVTANAAIVEGGTSGEVSVFVSDDSDIIIDINGFFATPPFAGATYFNPVTPPCRAIDTRYPVPLDPFPGQYLIPVEGSPCAPPSTATAYVLNATLAPTGPFPFLEIYPYCFCARPDVSTLNAYDGAITSNMAIVETNNGTVYSYGDGPGNLIVDLFGYFSLP